MKRCLLVAALFKTSNKSNPNLGISLHKPKNSFESQKGKAFFRTHCANFNPKGLFKICSIHFTADCFKRAVRVPGAPRVTVARAIPMIWKLREAGNSSAMSVRDRCMVGNKTLKTFDPCSHVHFLESQHFSFKPA